jgi:MFS family permease
VLVFTGLVLMAVTLLPSVPPALGVGAWAIAGFGIGQAYAPLSVTTLDRAEPGQEGRATSGLQLFDVLGQAVGTGVGGAIVAGTADGLGHRSGVALAYGFALLVSVVALVAGARLPTRLLARDAAAARPDT